MATYLVLLLVDGLEEQRLAPDMNVDERRLPVSGRHLCLLHIKGATRVQPPEDAPTEYDVAHQLAAQLD